MSAQRVGLSATLLLALFIIQESFISRIHFPITGFSLYISVLVALIALENRNGAIAMGFIGGIILDLSPTSDSPIGQWALIFTLIGFLISNNLESVGDFASTPFSFVVFVSCGSALSLLMYLLIGSMLGENSVSLWNAIVVILGNFIWTMLLTPFILPGLRWVREATLESWAR